MEKFDIVLGNGLGEQGEKTHGFVMYYGFMKAFFNMETAYEEKTSFLPQFISKTRKHLKDHVTRADILLAILLQTCCYPGTHNLTNVSRTSMYKQFALLFEKIVEEGGEVRLPLSYQQFCFSLEKLEKNGLITIAARTNGNMDIQLLHIEGEGRLFVVFHPAFFSKRFTTKSVAAMKLGILVTLQAGGRKNNWFERMLKAEETDYNEKSMMHGPLLRFLHLTQSSELKRVLQEWMDEPLFEDQFLLQHSSRYKNTYLLKQGRRFVKFACKLNPFFAIPSTLHKMQQQPKTAREADAIQYHYIIKPTVRYYRQASFLRWYISEQKLGDFLGEETEAFQTLLTALRLHGKDVIRHVIYTLSRYICEHKALPQDLGAYVDAAILGRKRAKIAQLAREANIHLYVTGGLTASTQAYHTRWKKFTLKVVALLPNITKTRKAFHHLSYFLQEKTDMLCFLRREYEMCHTLIYAPFRMEAFIESIREQAYVLQVDPALYKELEQEALQRLQKGIRLEYISSFMLQALKQLDRPSPQDFQTRPIEELLAHFVAEGLLA